MDYDKLKASIIQQWDLIKDKKLDELTVAELKKWELWSDTTEIAALLMPDAGAILRTLFEQLPKAEIYLVKAPIEQFSKWVQLVSEKEDFQKTEHINNVISIYKTLLEGRCHSPEGELVRVALSTEYKKCLAAFERIKGLVESKPEKKDDLEKADSTTDLNDTGGKKTTVKGYALLHVFWSKHDKTKAITDTNKLKFANEYHLSQNTLKKAFEDYYEKEDRKPASNDIRAVTPFINNLSDAVKLLETRCPEGFLDAKRELEAVKNIYLPKEKVKNSNPL